MLGLKLNHFSKRDTWSMGECLPSQFWIVLWNLGGFITIRCEITKYFSNTFSMHDNTLTSMNHIRKISNKKAPEQTLGPWLQILSQVLMKFPVLAFQKHGICSHDESLLCRTRFPLLQNEVIFGSTVTPVWCRGKWMHTLSCIHIYETKCNIVNW